MLLKSLNENVNNYEIFASKSERIFHVVLDFKFYILNSQHFPKILSRISQQDKQSPQSTLAGLLSSYNI